MADPKIRLKRSAVPNRIPTADQVPLGELALNTYDGRVYASKNVGIGTTVFAVNPWLVGVGTDVYDTYFTSGNVAIGTDTPTATLTVAGIVSATSFYGSGQYLTDLPSVVGISSGGVTVGSGVTVFDFYGDAIQSISYSSGIATISIGASVNSISRNVSRVVATAGQTTFSVNYIVGYLDVYLNGSKLDSTEYTATDGTSVVLTTGASLNDVLEFVAYNILSLTGTGFWGSNVTGIHTLSNVGIGTTTATSALTVSGDANVSGVITATGGFNLGISSAGSVITSGPITTLNFVGTGNTFAVNGTTVDISIQGGGGGGTGAGGTWSTYNAGIATSKSVGVNTTNLDDSNLTGVGNSFQGLYIGNGMVIYDNQLNGDHYIGTNFNGLMAGPVTINGSLTVDGNYVVV